MSVDLRHFRSFVVVAEEGHIAAPKGAKRVLDFDREDRGPLLITVGEHDHTVPPAVAKSNFHKYRHSPATTEFVEFPGRSHLLMAGEGWEEVAQYVADWLDRVLRPDIVTVDQPGG